jgi:hypothetical protein
MNRVTQIAASALLSGTMASLFSAAALILAAKTERKGALQPVNATSHWLHGAKAARRKKADASHTLAGFGTHYASALFWALPFEAWLAARPAQTPAKLLRDALVMSAIAAAVDYGITPKRLTPGWEHVLSKRSMLVAYGALALGLAAGAMLARNRIGKK